MAKKNKKQETISVPVQEQAPVQQAAPVYASWKKMTNCFPVPVARPADHIQLTPVIQPVPIIPYSTQEQPFLFEMTKPQD